MTHQVATVRCVWDAECRVHVHYRCLIPRHTSATTTAITAIAAWWWLVVLVCHCVILQQMTRVCQQTKVCSAWLPVATLTRQLTLSLSVVIRLSDVNHGKTDCDTTTRLTADNISLHHKKIWETVHIAGVTHRTTQRHDCVLVFLQTAHIYCKWWFLLWRELILALKQILSCAFSFCIMTILANSSWINIYSIFMTSNASCALLMILHAIRLCHSKGTMK